MDGGIANMVGVYGLAVQIGTGPILKGQELQKG